MSLWKSISAHETQIKAFCSSVIVIVCCFLLGIFAPQTANLSVFANSADCPEQINLRTGRGNKNMRSLSPFVRVHWVDRSQEKFTRRRIRSAAKSKKGDAAILN
jgi:hypothetical protein